MCNTGQHYRAEKGIYCHPFRSIQEICCSACYYYCFATYQTTCDVNTLLVEPPIKDKQSLLLAPKPVASERSLATASNQTLLVSGPSRASASKVTIGCSKRKCASCRDYKCAQAEECKGREKRELCGCTHHPITKNPCAPK